MIKQVTSTGNGMYSVQLTENHVVVFTAYAVASHMELLGLESVGDAIDVILHLAESGEPEPDEDGRNVWSALYERRIELEDVIVRGETVQSCRNDIPVKQAALDAERVSVLETLGVNSSAANTPRGLLAEPAVRSQNAAPRQAVVVTGEESLSPSTGEWAIPSGLAEKIAPARNAFRTELNPHAKPVEADAKPLLDFMKAGALNE